jgi:hypothetical protein
LLGSRGGKTVGVRVNCVRDRDIQEGIVGKVVEVPAAYKIPWRSFCSHD